MPKFIDFNWVEGELCEVNVILENPLPVELKVSSMVSKLRLHDQSVVGESIIINLNPTIAMLLE